MWVWTFFLPVLWSKMDKKIKNKNENEGLGTPKSETQSKAELSPSRCSQTLKSLRETCNPVVSEGGVASTSKQHSVADTGVKGTLTKTQKRNRRRSLKRLKEKESRGDDSASTSKDEVGGRKRPWSVLSNPSPGVKAIANKPRQDHQHRSFAQAVNVSKIAIVKENFPTMKLIKEEADIIQMEILKRIDSIPMDGHLPRIQGSNLVNGALILVCENIQTEEWVHNTFHHNGKVVQGVKLNVVNAAELPKPVKVAFKTRNVHTKEPADLLRRLNWLNPELKSEDWRVLHRHVEPQSILWIFEVELDAAEAIKRAGFGAYTGLDRGVFKILRAPPAPSVTIQELKEKGFKDVETSSKQPTQETPEYISPMLQQQNQRLTNLSQIQYPITHQRTSPIHTQIWNNTNQSQWRPMKSSFFNQSVPENRTTNDFHLRTPIRSNVETMRQQQQFPASVNNLSPFQDRTAKDFNLRMPIRSNDETMRQWQQFPESVNNLSQFQDRTTNDFDLRMPMRSNDATSRQWQQFSASINNLLPFQDHPMSPEQVALVQIIETAEAAQRNSPSFGHRF